MRNENKWKEDLVDLLYLIVLLLAIYFFFD